MESQGFSPQPPDAREYFRPLWNRKWLILAIVVLTTVGTYAYYNSRPKQYVASTNLYVSSSQVDQILGTASTFVDPDRTNADLAQLMQSRQVAEAVRRKLGYSAGVGVAPASGSDFLRIVATSSDPKRAADVANAYATTFIQVRAEQLRSQADQASTKLQKQLDVLPKTLANQSTRRQLQSQIQSLHALGDASLGGNAGQQVDPAVAPSAPSAPHPKRSALYAFALSLVLAIALAYILDRLDRRVRRVEDVEAVYRQATLAALPHAGDVSPTPDGTVSLSLSLREAFRSLRVNIQLAALDRPPRTLLVTSAVAGEGKSTVVRNLALVYREAGMRVAVVESDLRHPTLSKLLLAKPAPGLTNVLTGNATMHQSIQTVPVTMAAPLALADAPPITTPSTNGHGDSSAAETGTLSVLTSGPQPANPPAVLGTEKVRSLFDEIASEYDIVLIDSAPLLGVSDSVPLLSIADATIVVCRLGASTFDGARRVVDLLNRAPHCNVIGVVANDVPERAVLGGYGYGYHADPSTG